MVTVLKHMKFASYLVTVTLLFALVNTAHAQEIDFAGPVNIGDASDIATNGTYVDALETHGNNEIAEDILNPTTGVYTQFNLYTTSGSTGLTGDNPANYYGDSTFTITADGDTGGDGSGSAATPYQAVLNGSTYTNYPAQTPTEVGTVTMSGLTPGASYQVQVWASAGYRNETYTSANSQNLNFIVNGTGQYVIGTFIAPAAVGDSTTSSEYFTYQNTYAIDVSAGEIDAIDLRETPEPSTYAMMIGGLALLGLCLRRKLANAS
jgi:hypothetical protein